MLAGVALGCGPAGDDGEVLEVGGTISQPQTWEGLVTVTESVTLNAKVSIKPCTTINVWIEILDQNTKVTSDVTWKKLQLPYYVQGLTVEAKLEIAAGVQLLMDAESSIAIQAGGGLHTAGVEADPVVIQSFKDAPAAGDWYGISVYATSNNDSELNHTVIRHGGFSVDAGAMFVEVDAQISLNNVVFEDNKDCDIERRGTVVATETTFVDCPTP